MTPKPSSRAPVAIGGLGGSGTRVFAALLQAAGIYIGDDLNTPLDNLWFTVLFKRAEWGRKPNPGIPDPAEVATSIILFQRAMTEGLANELSPSDRGLLARLRADLLPEGDWQCGAQTINADRLMASLSSPGVAGRPWGWKEPNTHVFLPHLDRHIQGFCYIHIVRDGFDMAFSNNTWQARHWGHLYSSPDTLDVPPALQQMRYWTAANRAAIDYGVAHMPGRFLVVRYEDFCVRPNAHWARILRFLGLPVERPLPEDLVRPSTIGRSAKHDLTGFPAADLAEVHALQSIIEKIGQPAN